MSAMVNSKTKTGRPTAVYRTSWGEQVPGLRRLKDGRWRTSWPNQITFSEPDERLAVARYRQWEAQQNGNGTIAIPQASATVGDPESLRQAAAALPRPATDPRQLQGTFLPPALLDRQPAAPPASGSPIRIEVDGDRLDFYGSETQANAFWAWLRRLIINQPKLVAQMTGIEQIGYLADLRQPTPSPTLDDLIECYAAKPGITKDEVSRCRRFWVEFARIVGIKTIRELTHEHVEQYEAQVAALGLAAKSVKHRYTRVRTVVAYAMKRGKGSDDCRRALDTLAMLEVENVNTLDPHPITPNDFWKIHAAAENAGDKVFAALMLFAVNAALYSSEVGAVRWDDIDLERGEFSTRRSKTRVPRVSVLWPETVKALKALSRDRETIFNTSVQAYNRFSVHRDWTNYRKAAKVKDGVTFAMIRDAAFTTACRVSLDQARVLAGHRLPGAVDHYVLRAPQFVADACKAIHDAFWQAKPKAKGKAH